MSAAETANSYVEVVHSYRVLESGARWSEWRISASAPINKPLAVARLIREFSQDQTWLGLDQQHRLQVGLRLDGGSVIEIENSKLEALL